MPVLVVNSGIPTTPLSGLDDLLKLLVQLIHKTILKTALL